jgi:hypothetical protein
MRAYNQARLNKPYHILLMFLSPVLGLAFTLKSKSDKYITFFGTLFFGILGSLFIYIPGNDGHTHMEDVKRYYLDMTFIEFTSGFWDLLTFKQIEASNDLYKHIISYLAGGVLRTPELIHLFGGLLLGYFFTKSVLLVLENLPKHKKGILLIAFIALFLIVRSVSALNSLRMWTAMWVFFYGSFAYIKRKDTKYLWIIGLSIFIHFSYLLYVIPLVGAMLLRRKKLIIIGLFMASFVVNVGFQQATGLIGSAGIYQDKIETNVIDEDEIDRRGNQSKGKESGNFYKEFGPYIYNNFSILLLSFILVIIYYKNDGIEYLNFLIAGGLLLLALSNLAETTSPSIHGRGYTIAATFLSAAAIQILSLNKGFKFRGFSPRLFNTSIYFFLASSIPYALFHISYALNTISAFVLCLPFLSWISGNDDFSIRDFIAFILL